METDLLIIGGGPAGLNAAIISRQTGAHVTIVDEAFSLGGQLQYQTKWFSHLPGNYKKVRGTTICERLINQVKALDINVLEKHIMLGSYSNGNIAVSNGETTFEIKASRIILATGAAEETIIFPGWTTPGVITAGAAQILMNRERVLPGKNVLMLGLNKFSIEVAEQLKSCGADIKAFVEDKDSYRDNLLKEDIPVYFNTTIESTLGKGEVEKVILKTPKELKELDVDLVVASNGFSPILEPFQVLGCHLSYQENLGGWLPKYSERLQTSHSLCYLAGDAAGITTLSSILLTGEIAAISVLEDLHLLERNCAEKLREELWVKLSDYEQESENVLGARIDLINEFYNKDGDFPPEYIKELEGGIRNG